MNKERDFFDTQKRVQAQIEDLNFPWLGKEEADAYATVLTAGLANEARLRGVSLEEHVNSWGLRIVHNENGDLAMEGYKQPVNPDVDWDVEVPVLELRSDTDIPVTRKTILDRLAELVKEGAFVTLDKLGNLEIPDGKKKRRHLVYSSRAIPSEKEASRQARDISLMSLADVLCGSVLIESVDNRDADKNKPDIKSYHRFYAPLKTNDGTFTIRIVAESRDGKTLRPVKGDVYDLIVDKEDTSLPPTTPTLAGLGINSDPDGSRLVIRKEAPPLRITIRKMLRGVKDVKGEPYVFEQSNDTPRVNPPRGSITFGNGETIIELFKSADRSTFLHEMGHLFLESRRRLSLAGDVPRQVKEDWKTVTKWLDVENIDFSQPLQPHEAERWRSAQEKWAAGFERYFMEGKAPSPELTRAFEDFKEWLSDIYQAAKNVLHIGERGEKRPLEISNEIRDVMGRILARQEPEPEPEPEPERHKEGFTKGDDVIFFVPVPGENRERAVKGKFLSFDEKENVVRIEYKNVAFGFNAAKGRIARNAAANKNIDRGPQTVEQKRSRQYSQETGIER
jgi:hypothetical protein